MSATKRIGIVVFKIYFAPFRHVCDIYTDKPCAIRERRIPNARNAVGNGYACKPSTTRECISANPRNIVRNNKFCYKCIVKVEIGSIT